MKLVLMISIVSSVFLFQIGSVFAHGEEKSGEQANHASEHKLGKRHHRGHHRNKISKVMMKKADSNDDGKVDLNEYLQNAQQRFESMDANSDGYVTGEEMREASKTMRKKHKEAMKAARKSYEESVEQSK